MTIQTVARELAQRFGARMCDENGETHDEELYCLDLYDIIDMAKALAQPEQEPVTLEVVYETIIQWDECGGKRS